MDPRTTQEASAWRTYIHNIEGNIEHVRADQNRQINFPFYGPSRAIKRSDTHSAWSHHNPIHTQLKQSGLGHHIKRRTGINQNSRQHNIQTLDGDMQRFVVCSTLRWKFIIRKTQTITSSNVGYNPFKLRHDNVLSYVSGSQNFHQSITMSFRMHQERQDGDLGLGLIKLVNHFVITFLNNF